MEFQYDCTSIEHDSKEYDELIYLLENSELISSEEFYKYVGKNNYIREFEDKYSRISDSSMIHCYKGKLPDGTKACYFDYSRIEHVFY